MNAHEVPGGDGRDLRRVRHASGRRAVSTLAGIEQRGEITWGADVQGGEPYVYEDPTNPSHLIGFEVDIMDAIARRLGVKARMVQYDWSNLVPSLERGDFDVVMNGLEATPDRARADPAVRRRTSSTPRR